MSNFPTMGTSAATVTPVGPDSAHTISAVKEGSGKSDAPDNAGTAVARRASLEHNGGSYRPKTTRIVASNEEIAASEGRNVRLLPSATGTSGFWAARSAASDGAANV